MSLLFMTACYNDFSDAKEEIIYDDELIESIGGKIITIADLKQIYVDVHGTIQGFGTTSAKNTTRYVHFVDGKANATEFEQENNWYFESRDESGELLFIKGKVISNDKQGNVYKSLYIFDGTGAIELKLANGLYLEYECDLQAKTSQWVYVCLNDLFLGNYRLMLSLGDIPTESINAWGNYKYYSNSNITSFGRIRQQVLKGEKCTLTEGPEFENDILEITESNFDSKSGIHSSNPEKYFGRLIRFKDVRVMYRGVENQDRLVPAPLLNGSYDQIYPSWICTSGLMVDGALTQVVNQPWYKLAYSKNSISLYGSMCVGYNEAATYTSDPGVYIVRTSGYSKFANRFIPKDGARGDVLGIYCIYTGSASKSPYTGGQSDYATYQITVSRLEDMTFDMEPESDSCGWKELLLWAEENYPSYTLYKAGTPEREEALKAWKQYIDENTPKAAPQEWVSWGEWVLKCIQITPEKSYTLPETIKEDDEASVND